MHRKESEPVYRPDLTAVHVVRVIEQCCFNSTPDPFNGQRANFISKPPKVRDHPFKTSACLRGGGVSPCADGRKVTVHKDQKSPS